jgi:hypothetical protein
MRGARGRQHQHARRVDQASACKARSMALSEIRRSSSLTRRSARPCKLEAGADLQGAVLRLQPARFAQVRRLHLQQALLDAHLHARQGRPGRRTLAPGDAAGFGAAEDFDRRLPPQRQHARRRGRRQGAAGTEAGTQAGLQRAPVERVGQALEQGRAGDQHRRCAPASRGDLLRIAQARGMEDAAGRQRPQHAEQQAVDVLVRNRAVHDGIAHALAELCFQRGHFRVELAQGLGHRQGIAGGAGGVQDEQCFVGWQRPPRRHVLVLVERVQGVGETAGEAVDLRGKRARGGGQGVGWQDHGLARLPGAEQRGGELDAVLQVQREAAAAGRREGTPPGRQAAQELGARHHARGARGDRPAVLRVCTFEQLRQRQALRHARPAHARVGAPAIRRRIALPSTHRR